MDNGPEDSIPIVIHFEYRGNYKNCSGKKKRRLNNEQRSKFAKLMVNEKLSASRIRRVEAARTMVHGDPEPSTLSSESALRIVKCRAKKLDHLDSDHILGIAKTKKFAPYNTILKEIGYDEFCLHYWSTAQVDVYRLYTRQNIIKRVSIDATRSVVQSITLDSERQTRAIFFYEVAVNDKQSKLQNPVAHMLSERHHNTAVTYWLLCWLRADIQPPKICVVDHSFALIMACTHAFTKYRLSDEYISVRDRLLRNDLEETQIPMCMIRIDFAHVMKWISTWVEVKMAAPRTKKFYLHTAASIISSTCVTKMKKLLKCLFTVLLSEGEGDDDAGNVIPCEITKNYIIDCISRGDVYANNDDILSTMEANLDNMDGDSAQVELDVSSIGIFQDICTIYKESELEAELSNVGSRDNLQFCPALAKKFLNFCKHIILWSGIMVPIFKYGNFKLRGVVFFHEPLS